VGSMVWTLFDYFGEPYMHSWPHVTSSYGSFDVAGFPKAAVWCGDLGFVPGFRDPPRAIGIYAISAN
jgi:hypothetical protein